jgi:prepilin-type N-terminal cleavage/methylation domain-containing protein
MASIARVRVSWNTEAIPLRPSLRYMQAASRERGFTLVELMVVVVIVGVLAAIGIAAVAHYVHSAKTSEASAVVQAIRVGEERFRAENQRYLSVSGPPAATLPTTYYPSASIGRTKSTFFRTRPPDPPEPGLDASWRLLDPPLAPNQLVQFGYVAVAGPPGVAMPAPHTASKPVWPAAGALADPWYVIEARGDVDGDGVYTYVVASSLNGELYVENEGD